jgi:hypothetical protein
MVYFFLFVWHVLCCSHVELVSHGITEFSGLVVVSRAIV